MGIMHFWGQGDWISHGVAILLGLLSLFSWIVIFDRFFRQLRMNRDVDAAFDGFWEAADLQTAVTHMRKHDRSGLYAGMAEVAKRVAEAHNQSIGIGAGVSQSEAITRALRALGLGRAESKVRQDFVRTGHIHLSAKLQTRCGARFQFG